MNVTVWTTDGEATVFPQTRCVVSRKRMLTLVQNDGSEVIFQHKAIRYYSVKRAS